MSKSKLQLKIESKIKTPKEFVLLAKKLKESGKTLVQCDGVFDLVHIGHISSFHKAKSQGDVLYVVLVADQFVKKGPGRPIFNQDLRALWVAAIEGVDFVVINDDYGPRELMRRVCPSVLVKGAEYQTKPTEGFLLDKKLIESQGGRVVFSQELAHSSDILKKIYQNF